MKRQFSWKRLLVGIVFLVVALVVLGELLNWFKSQYVLAEYWPILLIFTGFLSMNPGNTGGNAFSFGIMGLGLLLLLRNYGLLAHGYGEVALLIMLVIAGIGLMAFAFGKPKSAKVKDQGYGSKPPPQAPPPASPPPTSQGTSSEEPKRFYYPKPDQPKTSQDGDRLIDDSRF